MTGVRPYCTFQVDGLWLGLDVDDVQEVIRHRSTTRVPTASPVVQGLLNLRGQIVTVLDLRGRLGLASPGPWLELPMDVVVRSSRGAVGLLVDEVGDIVEVDEAALERIPETIPDAVRRLALGLYPSLGRSLLVLDVAKVIE